MPNDPQTIDNDDKAAEALRFQHQCYLATYWSTFAEHNRKNRTYSNFVCLNSDLGPTDLVEKLTATP